MKLTTIAFSISLFGLWATGCSGSLDGEGDGGGGASGETSGSGPSGSGPSGSGPSGSGPSGSGSSGSGGSGATTTGGAGGGATTGGAGGGATTGGGGAPTTSSSGDTTSGGGTTSSGDPATTSAAATTSSASGGPGCGDGACDGGETCESCATDCGACPECEGASDATTALDAEEQAFLTLINEYRAENGRGPLMACTSLSRAAQGHSEDMRDQGYFSHDSLDGRDPWERACNSCFEAGCGPQTQMAENIAAGNSGAAGTFEQWRTSSGHNANMLGSSFVVIGIGRATGGGPYGSYWTTVYAASSEASCN